MVNSSSSCLQQVGPATGELFLMVRQRSEELASSVGEEDQQLQSMPEASPTKWHLAHTTWFLEQFCLRGQLNGYQPFNDRYGYLFNSYYDALGPCWPRAKRGLISKPTVGEIRAYRQYVDEAMLTLIAELAHGDPLLAVVYTALHHEQQHQELILTDIKHALFTNPLRPRYQRRALPMHPDDQQNHEALGFVELAGGRVRIGVDTGDAPKAQAFAYDHEGPAHDVLLGAYQLAQSPVTCGDFMCFMADGGYQDPRWWLADGFAFVQRQKIEAPLYWEYQEGTWLEFTLHGEQEVHRAAPVCHISFYEADAYARWAGARLPTEAEWEAAAQVQPISGHFSEADCFHPRPLTLGDGDFRGLFGSAWEWTASPYIGYPKFRSWQGVLGAYNGQFMCNQWVLRGGSVATPESHIRPTYRNYFGPSARWQFSGLRLAK